ncbi:hypothetical protein EXIGLDRAFT_696369 [Exidia glandulosa HHB12029]|uniref:Transmembrane protein n=1 Tax=Exidia glandulosa HHB12029 TaxID=1314781 RepID=A0A165N4D0_EXIGL|nr:hypothetical protein EXIGLDRAFT_696369 [Exidia glandulosa HHB12029]
MRTVDSSSWTFDGQWTTAKQTFSDGTHFANQTVSLGDSISFSFYGAAVQLTGFLTPSGGLYNVTLDNVTTVLNANAPWTVETMLFTQMSLEIAQHTLTIANAEAGKTLVVRSAAVAQAPLPPSSTAPIPTPTGSAEQDGLPKGTVIALIVGAAVAFVCLIVFVGLIVRYYRRRRRRRQERQRRIENVVDLSSDYSPPPAPPPSLVRYPRPPHLPFDFSSRPPSSIDYDSRVNSPEPPSLRAKIARTFMPHVRDGSSSSGRSRSLSRRSYLRSLNSLHQHYLYDSRDRDDVAFNTPDDPDAGFRIHDEPVQDPDDGELTGFEVDADAIFAALSKTPEGSPKNSVRDREQGRHRGNNRALQASFLEFTTSSSSGHHSHSPRTTRTSSVIRSMTASEISGTEMSASANIPYFVPVNQVRSSGIPTTSGGHRRSSLSFTMTHNPQRSSLSQGMAETTFPRSRTGVISFSQTIDTDMKTPSDSVPRSVSPGQRLVSPLDVEIPTRGTSANASAGHSPAPPESEQSEQFYTAASGMHSASHTAGEASSSSDPDPAARPAIPSGQSSQFLAHHLQTSSGSPVPSSIDIRGDPSPSTSLRTRAPRLPPLPPPGPPPPLPHPFSMVGPSAPTGAPPVQVQVLPASPISPPASPSDRRSPSPPPWPLPTRSHKERVLRRLLGVDSSPRPPMPDFDR